MVNFYITRSIFVTGDTSVLFIRFNNINNNIMSRITCIDPIIKILNLLRKEGLLPNNKFKLKQILQIIVHALFFTLIMSINITNIVKAIKTNNGMELNRVTCITIPIAQLLLKGLALLMNKKYFFLILDDLKSDTFNSHSVKLNVYIEFVYKLSDLLRKYYILAISLFVLVAAILPFISNMRLMMPAPFYMGKYIFFYKIIHLLMTIYLATNSISLDVMYMSLMALCIAQLNILEEKLINIFEESRKAFQSRDIKDTVMEEETGSNIKFAIAEQNILKECIIHHEKINK